MIKPNSLILASKSEHRFELMTNAGLEFKAIPAEIDERAIEEATRESGLLPGDLAQLLANSKANNVSEQYPDAYVIGSDQTLSLDGVLFHKPNNMDQARRQLLDLSGKTHELNSAISLSQNGEILWQHVSVAYLSMRDLTPEFIGRHLSRAGQNVLTSVGAYQLEYEGIHLFDKIEGDFFTIVGLPMLPLLKKLRQLDIIDG